MKNARTILLMSAVALTLLVGTAQSYRTGPEPGEGDFAIYASPSNIVLSAPCPWVTLHTDIKIRDFASCIVAVNEIPMTYVSCYSDSLGNLVVKLKFDEVVECVAPPAAKIVLEVTLKTGDVLTASDIVRVQD